MNDSFRTGFSFGLTSAVITTLGLMIGLHSGTHSRGVVIGGILTIAIADAFSDSLGIHISEESENAHTTCQIWCSTIATFASKFLFTMSFLIPVILFSLKAAIAISLIWGFLTLTIFSYLLALKQKKKPWKIIFEHLFIAFVVIGFTHFVGNWVSCLVK